MVSQLSIALMMTIEIMSSLVSIDSVPWFQRYPTSCKHRIIEL